MISTRKTTQDVLQEEIFRERLAVLVRTGENLTDAWDRLEKIGREIEAGMVSRRCGRGRAGTAERQRDSEDPPSGLLGLNGKIREYNNQRERVRRCYYYLIVTREALGLIHHQRLEEMYRLPPKKPLLEENERQGGGADCADEMNP